MVRNSHVEVEWKMGSRRWGHDFQLQWKWAWRIPWIQCFGTRSFAKQRKRKIVQTFLWWRRHSRRASSHNHFRQSVQYLWSSSGHVRRIGHENLWLFMKGQGNLLPRTIRRPWWCQQNCRQRTKRLEPLRLCKETCRTITTENSEIFQIIFNWPNCTDVGVTKTAAKRKYFTTLDDAELDIFGGSCREYTLPRDDTSSKVKGWIRGNTKIGPALEVANQLPSRPLRNRDHVQLLISRWNSFMCDDCGWNKQINTWRNEGRNRREPHRRHWRQHRETCCQSKTETKRQCRRLLLRRLRYHIACVSGSASNQSSTSKVFSQCQKRWSDCFDMIKQYFEKKTEQSNPESWRQCVFQNLRFLSIGQFGHGWISWKEEVVQKKRYQYCVDPHSADTILCLRAIQGHSGGKHIDPTLQDNVLLLSDFAEHIYHIWSSHDLHSIIQ